MAITCMLFESLVFNFSRLESSLRISKVSITAILVLVALASIILLSASPVHAAGSTATVTTDQSDYVAGSTVYIYGSGFAYTTSVTLSVTDPNNAITTWSVMSDGSGAFSTNYLLDHVDGNYSVSASDS